MKLGAGFERIILREEQCGKLEIAMTSCLVIISASGEWRAILKLFPSIEIHTSAMGEWFDAQLPAADDGERRNTVRFFHGGWGKIAAAASAQYVIDHFAPDLLINLGTCGGFEGLIEQGEIVLAEKTIVYDIIDQMGDFEAHIAHYSTEIDLSWLAQPYPIQVKRTLLVSGDRDLLVDEIPLLKERYGAVAGDWESGAIAWVAKNNRARLLILRGVSDIVGPNGSQAYGNLSYFEKASQNILKRLVESLPGWINLQKNA